MGLRGEIGGKVEQARRDKAVEQPARRMVMARQQSQVSSVQSTPFDPAQK